MSLLEKAKALESGKGIDFMEGRSKGDMKSILGKEVTIKNYDFITDKKTGDEYPVFIVSEIEDEFFFGGSVLKNFLKSLDEEEKAELQSVGFKCVMAERKSKDSGRKYVAVVPVTDELPF